ncbi:MAG: ABC transporter substrate-binding protein [Actinomycetota bacterium]|nr:ABC transporter substrate-binding protein [Actinomycetota bacterium]MDQ6946820.1 ABC transporter substrate-binding protein [Actinomycetota bacterium]
MTHRRIRASVLVIVSVAMIAAACSKSGTSNTGTGTTTPTAPAGVKGGTLHLVGQGDVDSMDTVNGYYDVTYTLDRAFTRQLYTYPISPTFAGQADPVPDLATAPPTISNGGTVYTIHIRPGAMWNTTPPRQVTAADEVLGIKRLCNPSNPTGAPGYFTATIVGMMAYCDGFGKVTTDVAAIKTYINGNDVSGVKALDDMTVQFTLTQPATDFINILSLPFTSPAPIEYLNYLPGSPDQASHTISDGPYTISSYVATKSIHLVRNPAWQASTDSVRKAYVDEIDIVQGVASASAAVQQIQAGTADMEWDQNVPTSMLAGMVASKDPNLIIGPDGENFVSINPYISINLQSPNNGGALSKLPVRQALEYAFDKVADSQVYGGAAVSKPLNQIIPSGSVGYIAGYNPYPTPGDKGDPAKAKQLLQQAGYAPGQITLKLAYRTNTVHPDIATTDQAALQAAGFNVQLIPVTPANTIYTKYWQNPDAGKSGAWDIGEPGWIPDWFGNNGRSVISPLFDGRTYGKNSTDYGDYNSPTVNASIDKALSATSTADATTAWQDAARQVMQDAVVVPIGAQKTTIYHGTKVKNCLFWVFSQNCDITNLYLGS